MKYPKIITWKWLARDPRTGRWKELSWGMTEEQAAKWSINNGCTQIARISGSQEEHGGTYLGLDGPTPPMFCSPKYRKRERE